MRYVSYISTSFVRGSRDRHVHDWVEAPRSRSRADRRRCSASGAGRIEQPPLEDDPHRVAVAEKRDVRDAEPGEVREELLAEAELAVRVAEQQRHHRHVPLL
jgi:hypothetical protein